MLLFEVGFGRRHDAVGSEERTDLEPRARLSETATARGTVSPARASLRQDAKEDSVDAITSALVCDAAAATHAALVR
jgi:hypothetical protein